jgi:hypothetical protein
VNQDGKNAARAHGASTCRKSGSREHQTQERSLTGRAPFRTILGDAWLEVDPSVIGEARTRAAASVDATPVGRLDSLENQRQTAIACR